MHNRNIFIIVLVWVNVVIGHTNVLSQSKSSKKNAHHEETLVKSEKSYDTFLFPDLLQYGLVKRGDTSFNYEYYDKRSARIYMYDVKDVDDIDYIRYYKMFTRVPAAQNSSVSAPVEYRLICEYAHPGHDLWLRYDHKTGEITKYNIFRDRIVGVDTVKISDPKTNTQHALIYKYYRTEIKSKEAGEDHHH
jgi:hypothetical protein